MATKRLKAKINSTISQRHSEFLLSQAAARGIAQAQVLDEALELLQAGFLYQADTGIAFKVSQGKISAVPKAA